MKPVIGISVDVRRDEADERSGGRKLELNWNYPQLIAESGGTPVLIPPMAEPAALAEVLDGWLVPGGCDLDPAMWGEPPHPHTQLQDPARFQAEKALYDAAPEAMPVLGICYGAQMLNVAAGGALIQHLPDEVGRVKHSGGEMQEYAVAPGTRLAQAVGALGVKGRSYHHQAVGRLGSGLVVAARHADGTIEAIEAAGSRWLIGVQWHPERTPGDEATVGLFRAFVEAAARYRSSRSREVSRT
jgi:putative glutamine amidotransferase